MGSVDRTASGQTSAACSLDESRDWTSVNGKLCWGPSERHHGVVVRRRLQLEVKRDAEPLAHAGPSARFMRPPNGECTIS